MTAEAEATDILVRVSLQGAEFFLKFAGKAAAQGIALLFAALKALYEKNAGKQKLGGKFNPRAFLESFTASSVFSLSKEDMQKLVPELKRLHIPYMQYKSTKDMKTDGKVEISVPQGDAERFVRLAESKGIAALAAYDFQCEEISSNAYEELLNGGAARGVDISVAPDGTVQLADRENPTQAPATADRSTPSEPGSEKSSDGRNTFDPAAGIDKNLAAAKAEAMRRGDLAEAKRLHRKVSLTEFVISSFLFVLMWVNIDNIFSIMPNGEVYRAGKWVVFFIGLSKVVIALLQFGSTLIGFSRYYHWTLYFVFILTGLGIVSNWLFIPLWGISGAAIATLVTCCVSLAFQQWIVMRKIRSNPFSAGTLKMAVVIGLLFGLDALLPVLDNCWLDCAYRTAVVGLAGCALIYFGKVSEDVNGLLDAMVEKVRGKR